MARSRSISSSLAFVPSQGSSSHFGSLCTRCDRLAGHGPPYTCAHGPAGQRSFRRGRAGVSGTAFATGALLVRALTHSSFANDDRRRRGQRDARVPRRQRPELPRRRRCCSTRFPLEGEGTLSKARSLLVSEEHFAALARRLGLGPLLRLSPGEERAGGRDRDARLADAFEAVFAALLLDGGIDAAARSRGAPLRRRRRRPRSRRTCRAATRRRRSQERAQAEGRPLPIYRLVEESGPPHDRRFVYEVAYGESDQRAQERGARRRKRRGKRRTRCSKLPPADPSPESPPTASDPPSAAPSPSRAAITRASREGLVVELLAGQAPVRVEVDHHGLAGRLRRGDGRVGVGRERAARRPALRGSAKTAPAARSADRDGDLHRGEPAQRRHPLFSKKRNQTPPARSGSAMPISYTRGGRSGRRK